ncbi:glycoside hydrolase family 16 protein [Arthrobacter sp. AD-310]
MSASTDQPRTKAHQSMEEPVNSTRIHSEPHRYTGVLKRPLTVRLATTAFVALLGAATLGLSANTEALNVERVTNSAKQQPVASHMHRDQLLQATAPLEPTTEATVEPDAAPAPVPAASEPPLPETTLESTLAPASAPLANLASTSTPMPTGVPGGWVMTFNDEFNGSSLDTTKWSDCWFSPTCGEMNKVSTSPSNVAIKDGNLALTLASSTSGALVSSNPKGGAGSGYQFTTGYVEARIKFPGDANGLYNWPAFWSTGQSWPTTGENDIAEVLKAKMTVNYHSGSGTHNQGTVPGDWANQFHTFGLHRTATSSDVYFDGVKVKSYPTDDGNAPQYIVLNVGAASTNPVYGPASEVQVDYVRAWQ